MSALSDIAKKPTNKTALEKAVLLAPDSFIQQAALELAQLQAELAAKDKRIAELEYRLEYIRNNRTDSISVMYALNADSEEIAAAMQTDND